MIDENKTPQGAPKPVEPVSCDPALTRKEFIKKVLKGATLTGAILAAPKVLDKFFVPPAYAAGFSSGTNADTVGLGDVATGGGSDSFTTVTNDTFHIRGDVPT